MASEKADLPQDTDSFPPNYASSDVYTDSAPPAYTKTNSVRLQITRVVCFTVLFAGLLTGVFILAHTWITTKHACDNGMVHNLPGQSASLLQASILPEMEAPPLEVEPALEALDSNDMDSRQLDQESRLMEIPLPTEENSEEDSERLELAQEAMEEEAEGLQDLVEEVQKKVKLPVDLILGNPALAGKDVQCKVEKRMQNLGGGILSKTIIVTCDDEDDKVKATNPFESLLGSRPALHPPMSLLAPILKMMAARAGARLQRQMQPKPALRRFPQPMLQPIAISMSGPFPQPFPAPFPGSFDGPGPISPPIMNSMSMHGSMGHGPVPAIFAGHLPMPGNSIVQPNMGPMQFFPPGSSRHHHSHDEPHMPFRGNENMPFHNNENVPFRGNENMPFRGYGNVPFRGNENMPFRGNMDMPFEEDMDNGAQDERHNMPFQENFDDEDEEFIPGPEPLFRTLPPQENKPEIISEFRNRLPVKIIHGFPPQIPDAIKQIVSHIMKNSNKDGQNNMPVIAIKAVPEIRSLQPNQGPPKSKLLLPFPFRLMKLQTRGGRMLGNPEEPEDSFNRAPFPLPRGAISSGLKPHVVVPEAAGRALDSPVTLPSLPELPPMRFFPGRLLRLPMPLPEGRAITHMEMKENPNSVQFNVETNQPSKEGQEQTITQNTEEGPFNTNGPDFGPPRLHTVIRGPPPMQDNISHDSIPLPPFLRRFPPPPPKFAREGRSGIIREINPEAELVNPVEAKQHHMIMIS